MSEDGRQDNPPDAPLLQSTWWRAVKESVGWSAISDDPLILQRKVGPFSLAYAPHAFADRSESLPDIVKKLRETGHTAGATLVRWDVPWARERVPEDTLRASGLIPSTMRVQPPDTVLLPLQSGEDALMSGMKRKTRYNIGLSGRKGVIVSVVTGADCLTALPEWYRLYRETAQRDGIAVHSQAYYDTVIRTALELESGDAPVLELLFARHESDLLGGIITASWRGTTTYLYGASSSYKRNLMASYALQWEAIRRALQRGDQNYDFFGIPPSADPSHPMYGLYRFKTGFGGHIIHRAGAWDVLIRRPRADIYRSAEQLRKWYHFSLKKRFRTGGTS